MLPETAMWPFLAEELPADQPVDAVIPKARAEFVAIAHACAPGQRPTSRVNVGIQLGPITKTLDVIGDRTILHSRVGDAEPFVTMPVGWERAFGGPGFAGNPVGKGANPVANTDGLVFAVPNVLDPKQPENALRAPAGFAPIDPTWPVRAQWAGTYDDRWLKHDFPGFARDVDWRNFNIAPADQWFADGLAGDESYAFTNLHPEQPLLRGRLPGMIPRVFVVRKGFDELEEVAMSLTTVWCFPHRERLVTVHHGRVRLSVEDGTDIARIVVGADRLGALRPLAAFDAVLRERLDRNTAGTAALRDEDLVPAEWLRPDPLLALTLDPAHARILGRARGRAEREAAQQNGELRERGLDPDKFVPPSPEPVPQSLSGTIAQARAEAEVQTTRAQAQVAAKRAEMAAKLVEAGISPADVAASLDAKPKGPPVFSAAAVRADLAGYVTAMRLLGQVTLHLEQQLASAEFLAQLEQAEAAARTGYRLAAHHQDRADAAAAERSADIRRLLASDTQAARAQYDLHGADLSGLDLSGVDLSGVCLDGADLTGTSFARARLTDVVLAHARMDRCILDGADLTGANLGRAHLVGASLRHAVLCKSVLAGADLTDASLAFANLEGADLSNAILTGADLASVRAPMILALTLSLKGLSAPGILLDRAKFIECDLEGADLTSASMNQVVFVKSNLAGLRCRGAVMRKAVFVGQCNLAGADLFGCDLTEANLRETALPGATLDHATLKRADLSGTDLTGAQMNGLRAAGSQWVGAVLRDARLRGSNLSQADLTRADLRGADLSAVSVYEANLARVLIDPGTVRGGMFTTRMRYLPLAEPAAEPP